MKTHDIAIIGGGASGMMAAVAAARAGASVVVVEKNRELGKKLSITGGGRCNIYNAEENVRTLVDYYGAKAKFLHSAFSQFGVDDSNSFFQKIGLPTSVEGKKRAFPVSQSAEDVVAVLRNEMKRLDVKVVNAEVYSVICEEGIIAGLDTSKGSLIAKEYVLATGGLSKPETGSTGDGFHWLEKMGHTIAEPTPNVTPLGVFDDWVALISGVRLDSMQITYRLDGKKAFQLQGELLFTHFGISGPLILNSAYRVSELLQAGIVTATIDTSPDESEQDLDARVNSVIQENPLKLIKSVLKSFIAPGLLPAMSKLLENKIDLDKKTSQLSKEHRLIIVRLIKAMPLRIEKLMGFEKAVVADGGLEMTELNTRTMQSLKIKNLYVTGDLLNINRPTGGYSLQLCWTTGFIAGSSAASSSLN